jgi:Ca-activated chloride channel family protein
VQKLIPPEKPPEEGEEAPNLKPDEIKFDDKGEKGKTQPFDVKKQTADMWMRNIQTTPRDLLRRKFAIEAQEGGQ